MVAEHATQTHSAISISSPIYINDIFLCGCLPVYECSNHSFPGPLLKTYIKKNHITKYWNTIFLMDLLDKETNKSPISTILV